MANPEEPGGLGEQQPDVSWMDETAKGVLRETLDELLADEPACSPEEQRRRDFQDMLRAPASEISTDS
jgi:hypothetical protein